MKKHDRHRSGDTRTVGFRGGITRIMANKVSASIRFYGLNNPRLSASTRKVRVDPLLKVNNPRQSASTNGQFLIEAIVAGSILIVGLSGIFALLGRAMHLNRVVTDNYVGTYLAAEGIEIVKNIIDHNMILIAGCTDPGFCSPLITPQNIPWDLGINPGPREADYEDSTLSAAGSGRFLRFDSNTKLYGYRRGSQTSYKRTFGIRKSPPPDSNSDEIEVVSTVTWATGGLSGKVELVDRFLNWRPPACNDGLDNDGDSQIDYPADPGCTSATDNRE